MSDSLPFSSAEVRSFLLGDLAPETAEEIEERFVLDSAFFAEVETAEDRLISEYLDGRLEASERSSFENKYLTNRELSAKVSFARDLRTALRRPNRSYRNWSYRNWSVAAVAIAATIVLAVLVRDPARRTGPALPPDEPASASAAVHLTPGVEKGSSSAHRVSVSNGILSVELDLTVPGSRTPWNASAEVLRFLDRGTEKITTFMAQGHIESDGIAFVLRIPAASLPAGDYVVYLRNASTPSAAPVDSFVFSVTRP